MHQWLVDGDGRLGLVDFDRYALGEPELDIATFLVELETESPRAVPMAELTAAVCSVMIVCWAVARPIAALASA